ncbi:MAG TPA: exopolysaccharide biosynthesis polyprenyl glycosylphosphotransferase [Chthoniobacter sp.]|jgi:exopolysaccharide biosynthesis polyprenyl glycosylphosphotransferase
MISTIDTAVPLPIRRYVGVAERLLITALVADTCVILYGLAFAFWLRFYTGIAHYGVPSATNLQNYLGYLALGSVLMLLTLAYHRLYEKQTLLRYRHVSLLVLKSSSIWFIGFLSFALVFHFQPQLSRLFVLIAGANVTVGLLLWRNLFHRLLRSSPLVRALKRRVLFVGWSGEGERLTKSFQDDEASAYEVVGCIATQRGSFHSTPSEDINVYPGTWNLEQLLHRESIEIVIFADRDCARSEIVALSNLCEKAMVEFKLIPSYFQILVSGLHLETVNGVPVLGVSQLPLDQLPNVIVKRAFDVFGAIVGLVLSAPIIAVFGALVYLESPGPIFYRQRRLGQRGMDFEMFKLRSMRLDAESNGQIGWTTANDPRRLKIGAFMRKWNIDEVPQFWNVLKGEMSLVGPRPERPELILNFKEEIPHYNARHNAKPGITGWAQINGMRGDTDLTKRIKCDLWYLENWSPLLDVQIMFMTFVKHDNAA